MKNYRWIIVAALAFALLTVLGLIHIYEMNTDPKELSRPLKEKMAQCLQGNTKTCGQGKVVERTENTIRVECGTFSATWSEDDQDDDQDWDRLNIKLYPDQASPNKDTVEVQDSYHSKGSLLMEIVFRGTRGQIPRDAELYWNNDHVVSEGYRNWVGRESRRVKREAVACLLQ